MSFAELIKYFFTGWKKETLIPQPRKEPGTWVCEGDSNTHFTNVKKWYTPDCTNFAIGGSTTADVILRIPEVRAWNPKRVTVQIGGNDVLRLIPIEVIRANFRTIVREYKSFVEDFAMISIPYVSDKIKIAGHIMPYPYYVMLTNTVMIEVCAEFGVPYIDIFTPLSKGYDRKYYVDGIHYNNDGRIVVYNAINAVMGPIKN